MSQTSTTSAGKSALRSLSSVPHGPGSRLGTPLLRSLKSLDSASSSMFLGLGETRPRGISLRLRPGDADFGTVVEGHTYFLRMRLFNSGTYSVRFRVRTAKTECPPGTDVRLALLSPTIVAPGLHASMELELDAPSTGEIEGEVTIEAEAVLPITNPRGALDDSAKRTLQCDITASVVSEADWLRLGARATASKCTNKRVRAEPLVGKEIDADSHSSHEAVA